MDRELRESLNLGEKIKRIRHDKGLRLSDLATLTECSISFLSQLENNKISPSVVTLYRLSEAFGRPIGYFFENFELLLISAEGAHSMSKTGYSDFVRCFCFKP